MLAIAEQNAIKEHAIMIDVLRLCKSRRCNRIPLTRSRDPFCWHSRRATSKGRMKMTVNDNDKNPNMQLIMIHKSALVVDATNSVIITVEPRAEYILLDLWYVLEKR